MGNPLALKLGGLHGKMPWNVLGTCSGLATNLVGSRRGPGRTKNSLISKMAKSRLFVPIPLLQVLAFMNFQLRLCMDATWISDGRPVMLKRFLNEVGPYELQINKFFSTSQFIRIAETVVRDC